MPSLPSSPTSPVLSREAMGMMVPPGVDGEETPRTAADKDDGQDGDAASGEGALSSGVPGRGASASSPAAPPPRMGAKLAEEAAAEMTWASALALQPAASLLAEALAEDGCGGDTTGGGAASVEAAEASTRAWLSDVSEGDLVDLRVDGSVGRLHVFPSHDLVSMPTLVKKQASPGSRLRRNIAAGSFVCPNGCVFSGPSSQAGQRACRACHLCAACCATAAPSLAAAACPALLGSHAGLGGGDGSGGGGGGDGDGGVSWAQAVVMAAETVHFCSKPIAFANAAAGTAGEIEEPPLFLVASGKVGWGVTRFVLWCHPPTKPKTKEHSRPPPPPPVLPGNTVTIVTATPTGVTQAAPGALFPLQSSYVGRSWVVDSVRGQWFNLREHRSLWLPLAAIGVDVNSQEEDFDSEEERGTKNDAAGGTEPTAKMARRRVTGEGFNDHVSTKNSGQSSTFFLQPCN